MRRLLCILAPPVAVLSCGFNIGGALANCILMCFFYFPAVIHAWDEVKKFEEDERTKQMTNQIMALQEPLYLQAQSNLLAANAMAAQARQQRYLPAPEEDEDEEPEPINDPYIGVNGKKFRRRR